MPRFRRPAVAVLVLVALWPTLVLGQQPKAGVVSTLEGSATAARVALPQPVSLKFKDDVFLQDRITTGERSLVRLLLGGKASVTVRERSTLTITEVPGRSTVDLESGKVGVAVARDRMRPGEVLEIRMPTAIAAVRGTVVVAEVLPSGQINLFVLSGSAQLFNYNPVTRAPVGPGVTLNAGQVGSVTGGAPPVVGAFTPQQLAGIQGGLVPGGPQHDQPVNQNQIVALQMGTTGALVQALGLGTPGGAFGGQQGLPGSPDGQQQDSPDFVPTTPLTGLGEVPPPPPPVDAERVVVSGLQLVLQPGASLKTMAGQVARTETSPLIEVTNSGVSQRGADNLIQVLTGADWSLASPLLAATDSAFNPPAGPSAPPAVGRNLLDVQGALRTTAATPFLSIDPTTVIVPGDLVHVGAGGSLTIPGPLLSDIGGAYTIGGSLLSVTDGGSVTAAGPAPLIQLDGTTLTVGGGRGLIEVTGPSSQLTSGGPLLDLANLSLWAQSLADVTGGGLLTLNLAPGEPVVRLRNSTLALTGPGDLRAPADFVQFLGDTTRVSPVAVLLAFSQLTLDGPHSLLAVPASVGPIQVSGRLLRAVEGSFDVGGSVLGLEAGASLTASGEVGGALLRFEPATVLTGGPIVSVGAGATLALDRQLLDTVDSLVFPGTETAQPLVFVGRGGALTSTAAMPLVSVIGGGITTSSGGDLFWFGGGPGGPQAGATVHLAAGLLSFSAGGLSGEGQADVGGHLLRVSAGSAVRLGGPVADVTGSLFTVQGGLMRLEDASQLTFVGGPTVRVTGGTLAADSLLSMDAGTNTLALVAPVLDLTNGQASFRVIVDEPGVGQGQVTLAAAPNTPLIRMTDSTLTLTGDGALLPLDFEGPPALSFPGVGLVADPSTLVLGGPLAALGGIDLTGTQPFVQLLDTTVVQSGPAALFVVSGAPVTLAAPLLSATDSHVQTAASDVIGLRNQASLTKTGAAPLVELTGSLPEGFSTVLAGAHFLGMTAQAGGPTPSLTLDGPLLAATRALLTTGNPETTRASFVFVADGASLTGQGTAPLVGLDESTVNAAGSLFAILRAGVQPSHVQLAGPLLSSTGSSLVAFTTAARDAENQPVLCCNLLAVAQGATFTGTGVTPLVQLGDTTAFLGSHGVAVSLSSVVQEDGLVVAPSSLTLGGPLLAASGGSVQALQGLLGVFGSSLTSSTTAPLIQLSDTTLTLGGQSPFDASTTSGRILDLVAVAGAPATLSLQGPLLGASATAIATTDDAFGVFDGATLTSTTPQPLVSITGGSLVAEGPGNFFILTSASGAPASHVTLAGPLLEASSTTLVNGDSAATTPSFLGVFNGAVLQSTSELPLLAIDATSLDTAGNVVTVRGLSTPGATLTLAGPLFSATNGSTVNTTSLGAGESACCSGFFVGEGGQLTSSTSQPLIRLIDSTFNAGPDPQSGGDVLGMRDASAGSAVSGPATVTLAGPLLRVTRGSVSALFDLLSVRRSTFSSTTAEALVQLDGEPATTLTLGGVRSDPLAPGATAPGRLLSVVASEAPATTSPFPAAVGLGGPLLLALDGAVSTASDLIGVFNGATLTGTSAQPLLGASATSLAVGTGFPGGSLLNVSGTGGVSGIGAATATLAGPLLTMTGGALTVAGALVSASLGGTVMATGAALPFVALDGGLHTLGGGTPALFDVASGGVLSVPGGLLTLTAATTTLAAPVVRVATDAGSLTLGGPFLTMHGGGLTSGGPAPLVAFNAEGETAPARSVTIPDHAFRFDGEASVLLHGGVLRARATAFATTDETRSFLSVLDGATLTTMDTAAPLLSFTGTVPGQSQVLSARHLVALAIVSPLQPAPSMALSGPLLAATGTAFATGNPTANVNAFAAVLDGATLTSTTTLPLMSFDASSVDTAGGLLVVRRSPAPGSPSSVTLAGPLFVATNGSSFDTSSAGFGAIGTPVACCSAFSVNQGAQLSSTTTEPLIQLVGSTLAAGPDPVQSGGAFFSMLSAIPTVGELDAPATVTLGGPLAAITGGSTVTALAALLRIGGSTLTSSTPLPLIGIEGSTVTLGGFDPIAGAPSQGRVLTMTGTALRPATLSLAGPLFSLTDGTVTTTGTAFGIFDKSTVTSTTLEPFIGVSNGTLTAGAGSFLALSSGVGLPPSLTLAGPLLSVGSAVGNGDPTTNSFSFLFVADGAELKSTAVEQALITLLPEAALDSSGNVVDVRRAGKLTLEGPILLLALGGSTIDATSLGSPPVCCNLLRLAQGGMLTSTAPSPLLAFLGAQVNLGPDPQSGGNIVRVSSDGTLPADPPSPSTMTIAGGLAVLVDSSVSALIDFLQVQRSSFTSTSPDPLIHLVKEVTGSQLSLGGLHDDTAFTGRVLSLVSSATAGTVGLPAHVSLAGPLLVAEDSLVTISGDVAGVFNGAILDSTTTEPFVQIDNSTLALTAPASAPGAGNVLTVGGLGGADGQTPATVVLGGPLLSVASTLSATGSLVNVFPGGQLVLADFPEAPPALVSLDGGTHAIASAAGRAMFQLAGRATQTAVDEESGLTLATDQPIQAVLSSEPALVPASLLETTNATVTTQKVLKVDRALLEASAPVLSLLAASSLTSSTDAFELANQAKVTGVGSLVRLDASALTVLAGALVSVGGGSYLRITGDLVQLLNGSTLTLANGALLSVTGNSAVNLSGSLLAYGSGANTLSVANSLCSPSCTMIGGIPVALTGGAVASNVAIGPNAIRNMGQGGTLSLPSLSPTGPALISVSGPSSRVTVGAN